MVSPAPPSRSPRDVRLLVTVTLNPNQLRAHLEPIVALPEVSQVTLVADEPAPAIPKLTTFVPPPWLVRLLGRAGAKLVLCLVVALRTRPDWVLGYNLLPHGVTALLVGRLVRAKTLFHMIGGPVEWEGGGWRSDNRAVGRLARPVPALERLLLLVIRRFNVVAVMGQQGRHSLVRGGVARDRIVPLPASIDDRRFRPRPASVSEYQIITVAQLIPRKRLGDFIEAAARLRVERPELRAAIVGRGPAEDDLRAHAVRLGVDDAVDFLGFREDVETLYCRSDVFVLPSRVEGLSIAMAEAMASGLPAIVTDVGEVRDLVLEGHNGFLFEVGDVDTLVEQAGRVLDDTALRHSLSVAAARDARSLAGLDRVTEINRGIFADARSGRPPPGSYLARRARRKLSPCFRRRGASRRAVR